MKNCISLFLLSITCLIANAQIKVHTGGKVSIGSTTAPTYSLGVTGDADLVASGNAYRIQGNKVLWYNSTASTNIFVGVGAGNSISGGTTNSFMGYQAGYSNYTGGNNVFIGYQSGYTNSVNGANVFCGYKSGFSNNTGLSNSFYGQNSGYSNISGQNNVGIGLAAGYYNLYGSNNTYCGYGAGFGATTLSNSNNSFFGYKAGYQNTTGSQNTFVGYQAGYANTTGSYNTCVGYGADLAAATYTNAATFGYNASANASNKIRIGNTAITVIEGQVAFTTSDSRFKFNVTENVKGLEFIKKLRPVNYQFDTEAFDQFLMKNMSDSIKAVKTMGMNYSASKNIVRTGLLAQEVEKAANDCGFITDIVHTPQDGNDNYSIQYGALIVPVIKAMQEQQAIIDNLIAEISLLKAKMASMEGGKIIDK